MYFVGSRFHPPARETPSSQEDQGADQSTAEKADDRIARYTWWLAALTGTLTLATIGLMSATFFQIRLARKEFNATHRPEVIVHNFEVSREFLGPDKEAICAQFVVANKGTADAIIQDIAGNIFLTKHLRPGVTMPSLGYQGRSLAAGEIISDVAIIGTPMNASNLHFEAGFGAAFSSFKLWCIGRIVYEDSEGRRRETGFCRSYEPDGGRWVREPQSDYEYTY